MSVTAPASAAGSDSGYSGDSDFEDDTSSASAGGAPPTGLAEDSVGSFSDDSRYGIVISGALSPSESVAAAALEGTGGLDLNTDRFVVSVGSTDDGGPDLTAAPAFTTTTTPTDREARSATRIQQLARARAAHRRVAEKREAALRAKARAEKHSAVRIQSAHRSRVARRVVAGKRQAKAADSAAIKVQAQHRRRMGARRAQARREERALETQSAIRLQSLARGGLERRAIARRRALEAQSATAVQRAMRGRMARQRVARKRARARMRQIKADRRQRKTWSGLNRQIKSPYREMLTYKGITGRGGGGGIGLDAAGAARSQRLKRLEGRPTRPRADAVLIGGPSLLGGGSSSVTQTPLISLDPVADAYAAREIEAMVDDAGSEIMLLAQSSLESVMLAGVAGGDSSIEASRVRRVGSSLTGGNPESSLLSPSLGGSALLPDESIIPGRSRVDEMRKSIDFIKERFGALKQISQLDPATAAEGGWTEDAVEEELNKLKLELARERENLRAALHASSPALVRRRGFGEDEPAGSYDPNLSTASSVSAARERLFSESVARKLVKLTKRLDRTCRLHAIEVRRRRQGEPLRARERFSPLVSHKLHPSPAFHLKPLFRGDRSPEGIHRQRRRARASVTTRGRRRGQK